MPDKLQPELFNQVLAERCSLDFNVHVLATIDSTNSWSLQQCRAGKRLPFACFAEEQTQGRGRRGKHWLMLPFSNIAMSLSWPFDISRQPLNLLPVSISVAIAQSLESFGLDQVQVKWPNDIYVRGKKIAGVLIETRPVVAGQGGRPGANNAQMAVVIGVGLNYDMLPPANSELPGTMVFTDFREEVRMQQLAAMPGRTEVAASLLQHVVNVCLEYRQLAERNLELFRSHYDYCRQKSVEILLDDGRKLTGFAQGVSDQAELLVKIDGELYRFNSADVSVRTGPG